MKKVKNYINKINNNYHNCSVIAIIFVVTSLINSLILRFYTIGSVFYIKPLLIDIGILIIMTSFSFLIKPQKRIIYFMICSFITTAICCINSIYYTFYNSFASISLIATSTQVVDVGDAVVKNVIELKDFTFLWQPIFMYFMHIKLLKKDYYHKKVNENIKFLTLNTLSTGAVLLLLVSFFITPTEWGRFGKLWNREFVVIKFGIYTYQINDFFQSLTPKLNTLFGYDNAVKITKEYYKQYPQEIQENEYTNIYEGKNIIFIHAESIQTYLMDLSFNGQEVTPNLNKLAREGMFFSNFYAQVGVGNSSDSEFTLSTSLMPSNNGTVFISYFDREYLTIQKLLKENNYYTFSMHGNTGDFWNRKIMHANMGYDMFYHKSYYDIDETIGFNDTALSDKSFFRQSVPMIKQIKEAKNSPFAATLIMLTNHTPFDELDKMDEFPVDYKIIKNGMIVSRPYLEGTTMGNYIRSAHYADQAIGDFIKDLDNNNLLDNTVVVIYGDHDARLPENDYNILYNYDPYQNKQKTKDDEDYIEINKLKYELDKKVPFIIWTKDKQIAVEVEQPMGMIDVLPTLGNMFNFSSKYALGSDIFSTKDNMVVFSEGSFLTDTVYYDNQKGEMYQLSSKPIDAEYIKIRSEKANSMIEVSNNIIRYNLIKSFEE